MRSDGSVPRWFKRIVLQWSKNVLSAAFVAACRPKNVIMDLSHVSTLERTNENIHPMKGTRGQDGEEKKGTNRQTANPTKASR